MGNIALRNISLGNIVIIHKQPSTHSPDFSPDVELLNKHYRPVARHYGNIKLVRDKNTSETMLLKEIFVNTKEAFEQELKFFNKRILLKHPNVVDIIGFTSEESKNFCSNYFKVSVFFEVLDRDLQTDLEQRIKEKNFYSENELFLIADSLTSALSYFQNQGHAHGDIRPFNIFVKGYSYKLSDPSLNPQKLSNGLTIAIVEGAKALLAPELLEQVPQSLFEIKTDIHKADVFSLGATLLGLATLTNAEDMYDYKAGKINTNVLEERLETLRYRYSVVAYDLIKSMLTISVNERPDFFVFTNRLLPYQEEIRNLRPLPFASSNLTPYEPVHIDTQIHQYDTSTHHHYEEIVKKTGPTVKETHTYTHDYLVTPQPVTNVPPNDLLDTQIQAAIDRTEETLKILGTKEEYPCTGDYATSYAADPLSYVAQSPYSSDLTAKYLADEKEASPDYGVSSTQPSYRPTAANYYADISQRPAGELYSTPSGLQTSPYLSSTETAGFGISQSEGLLGSLLIQELSYGIEQLTQKLEEGLIPRQKIVISPAVATKKIVYEAGTLREEVHVGEEGQKEPNVPSSQEVLEKKFEQEVQGIEIQARELQKGPEKEEESSSSSSSEGERDVEEENLEKEKLREKEFEVQSAKETKEISQELLGRQEGDIEVIDRGGEQERPAGISEIQV